MGTNAMACTVLCCHECQLAVLSDAGTPSRRVSCHKVSVWKERYIFVSVWKERYIFVTVCKVRGIHVLVWKGLATSCPSKGFLLPFIIHMASCVCGVHVRV